MTILLPAILTTDRTKRRADNTHKNTKSPLGTQAKAVDGFFIITWYYELNKTTPGVWLNLG